MTVSCREVRLLSSVVDPGPRFYATREIAGTAFGRPPQLAPTTCGFFVPGESPAAVILLLPLGATDRPQVLQRLKRVRVLLAQRHDVQRGGRDKGIGFVDSPREPAPARLQASSTACRLDQDSPQGLGGGRLRQRPRVKSGKSTGRLRRAFDLSVSSITALQLAAS